MSSSDEDPQARRRVMPESRHRVHSHHGHRTTADAQTSDSDGEAKIHRRHRSSPPTGRPTHADDDRRSTKSRDAEVETVDRGVGPTPIPPPHVDPRSPTSFYSLPPHIFGDPRNGLEQQSPYALPGLGPYYNVPYALNPSLPLTNTLEGRYQWPPVPSFHHPMPGLPPSPSDVSSLYGLRSPLGPSGETVTALASRIHWEQLRQTYFQSPVSGRRYSPGTLPPGYPTGVPASYLQGLPLGSHGSLYAGDYPGGLGPYGARSMFGDIPPTPGSGSVTLPGSMSVESSRITSPRPSIVGNKSRKRALSHSPISDYLDIQSLTRSSEGSLQLTPLLGGVTQSRSSSAASGSYGHLSAASLGTMSPAMHPQLPANPHFRQGVGSFPPSAFFHPAMVPPGVMGRLPHGGQIMLPSSQHSLMQHPPKATPPNVDSQAQISTTTKDASSSVVSSTVEAGLLDHKRSKIKTEKDLYGHHHHHHLHHTHGHYGGEEGDVEDEKPHPGLTHPPGHIPVEGEPDFVETNCHWEDCSNLYDTQDELVKHINQEHIQANKKAFLCAWSECSRNMKPFKAQYMLVVHMRRHTGEKPHRCTFEGCDKAYSRLENLKTHLRSHTGEKPYMCEFPGCTKAFSNASDRAKHQNRTHSNAKPYVCKAPGCTKRYTDPSSLRKHVKTVHGPEFYANKKHKGDLPSCKLEKTEDPEHDEEKDGHKKLEECLSLAPGVTSTGERRRSQDNVGSVIQQHPSPQSSPEVNVTTNLHVELDEHVISGSQTIAVTGSIGVEEEVDIPEPDEAEVPGSNSVAVARQNRVNTNRNLSKRNITKNLAILPPVGSNRVRKDSSGPIQTSLTDLKPPAPPNSHRRIADLHGRNESQHNTSFPGRRDSNNSSTISSYFSSLRSDASPNPFGSSFSSRRSSEALSNRLSITNSPYEYDITGNRPMNHSRRSCNSESSANISNMATQLQKAHLGSHPNLIVQSQNSATQSRPSSSYQNETIARYLAARQDVCSARTTNSTPCRTPLPHENPNRDARRASDPVMAMDSANFSALKRLQRFHSLNTMKTLPVPGSMRSLQNKSSSNNTFNSSRSSIATYDSVAEENDYDSMNIDLEAALDEKMLEDNEDMIIPDDMRRFLNEKYGDGHPMFSYDPSMLTEAEILYLQQGTNQSVNSNANFVQNSNDGSNMGNQYSNNQTQVPQHNDTPNMQGQNFYENQTPNINNQGVNFPSNQSVDNNMQIKLGQGQMGFQGQMNANQLNTNPVNGQLAANDPQNLMSPLSRENTAAWVQSQNATQNASQPQNLPQPPVLCPPPAPPLPPQGMMHMSQNGSMPPPKPVDNRMVNQNAMVGQINNNWVSNNMQQNRGTPNIHQHGGLPNVQQPMRSPLPPNVPMPHPPSMPKMNTNNMPNQVMHGQISQGHMPHPPGSGKLERGSPQVQVNHVSQSQIPPRAKAANRNQMLMQQQQQQQQQQMMPNQNQLTVPGNFQNKLSGPQGQINPVQQQQLQLQQQQQLMIMQNNMNMQQFNGPMNSPAFNPNCQQSIQEQRSPYSKIELSPGCNQVTSSTDIDKARRREPQAPPIEDFMENLNSISAENFMDNIDSISQENLNQIYSPTAMSVGNRTNSQASRYSSALMNTSNMVVNDMSSTLCQLAEENRYFSRKH